MIPFHLNFELTHFDYFRDLQRLQPVDCDVKDSNLPFFVFTQF